MLRLAPGTTSAGGGRSQTRICASAGHARESREWSLRAVRTWFDLRCTHQRARVQLGVPTGASNFSVYCDRLMRAAMLRPDHSHARPQPASRAPEQGRPARIAKDVPVIPLYQTPLVYVVPDEVVRGIRPGTFRPVHLERGGLVARPLAFAAALAVSLLAVSGAGGAGAQTPKRGGTVVFAQAEEPACLNPFDERCPPGTSPFTLRPIFGRVLESAFEVGPDFTWRPRLVSSVTYTRRPPFVLTYHIRPEAQWSDGTDHGRGLRVHAPGVPEARPSRRHYPDAMFAASARSTRRRSGSYCVRAWGFPRPVREDLAAHALLGEDLATVWRDGIENPKTGSTDRKRPVPHRGLGPRQGDHAPSQSSVLGSAPGIPRPARHSFLRSTGVRLSAGFGRESSMSPPVLRRASFQPSSVSPASGFRLPRRGVGSFRDPRGPGRPSCAQEQAGSPRTRLRHRSRRARASCIRGPRRAGTAYVTASSSRLGAGTTGRTGALSLPSRRGAPAARAGGLPTRCGWHVRLRRRAALASLRYQIRHPATTDPEWSSSPRRSCDSRASRWCRSSQPFGALRSDSPERRLST